MAVSIYLGLRLRNENLIFKRTTPPPTTEFFSADKDTELPPPGKVNFLTKVKFITENCKRVIFCDFAPFLSICIYLRMAFTSQKMTRFNLSRLTLKKRKLEF